MRHCDFHPFQVKEDHCEGKRIDFFDLGFITVAIRRTVRKQPSSWPCDQRQPAIKFGQFQKFGTISQGDCWCDQRQLTTHNWCLWHLILGHWQWCCRLRDLVCIFFVQPSDSEIHDIPKFLGSILYSVASCELVGFFFKSQYVATERIA